MYRPRFASSQVGDVHIAVDGVAVLLNLGVGRIENQHAVGSAEELGELALDVELDVVDDALGVIHLIDRELQPYGSLLAQHLGKARAQLVVLDVVADDDHISKRGYWSGLLPLMKQR